MIGLSGRAVLGASSRDATSRSSSALERGERGPGHLPGNCGRGRVPRTPLQGKNFWGSSACSKNAPCFIRLHLQSDAFGTPWQGSFDHGLTPETRQRASWQGNGEGVSKYGICETKIWPRPPTLVRWYGALPLADPSADTSAP